MASRLDKYLKAADENGDDGIDWREFRVLWRKFPSLFYPAFALHEILSKYSSAAEHLMSTLSDTKAGEIARLRKEKLPKWGRKHPRLFGVDPAAAVNVDHKKRPSLRPLINAAAAIKRSGRHSDGDEKKAGGGVFTKLDLFEAGLVEQAGPTGDFADVSPQFSEDTDDEARRKCGRRRGLTSGRERSGGGSKSSDEGVSHPNLSKAARAHMKLKKQRERQFQSVVEEAQKEHEEMLRRQMWDADDDGTAGDATRRAPLTLTPPRHAAPPSAILSPSPRGGGRASRSQSRRGSIDRSQSRRGSVDGGYNFENAENDNPNVASPSLNDIWTAMQKCPSALQETLANKKKKIGEENDPILRPTPEKRGLALAPLQVTPDPPPNSRQQQPRRWQSDALRSRLSFVKSSLSGALVSEEGPSRGEEEPDSFCVSSPPLKSPQHSGVRESVTDHLRVAARGGGGVNGGGRASHRGRGAQRGARMASMRRQAALQLDFEGDDEAAGSTRSNAVGGGGGGGDYMTGTTGANESLRGMR